MTNRIEDTILTNLIFNEEYTRKVLPFLKDEYFGTRSDKIIFACIEDFVNKYNKTPGSLYEYKCLCMYQYLL